jgi:hypothetical protein
MVCRTLAKLVNIVFIAGALASCTAVATWVTELLGEPSKLSPAATGVMQVANGPPAVQTPSYLNLRTVRQASKVYELQEMAIDTDGRALNPFDPAQMEIKVFFSSPTGERIAVPVFWYQDYDPDTARPQGEPGWRVRFTPAQPGEWTARAGLADSSLMSNTTVFSVKADRSAHGFVRVSQENARYLGFDDGSAYFPIGLNMAWSTDYVLEDYQRWLNLLSQNGGNYIRVWMASRSFGIEWEDTGLGNYTRRLYQAWLLDQVFQMAQDSGIYIMLTLLNHGAFSIRADPEWSSNPYNVKLGGPCQEPQCFVTDPQAKGYFKRRLRYIAARWSFSPNLMAWEWWNEVDWTPIPDKLLRPWIEEMTASLKGDDPYSHLITNSYTRKYRSDLWSMPELSFAQLHDYSGSDPVYTFRAEIGQIAQKAEDKPILMGEYGNPSPQDDYRLGTDGTHLHNGLWAAPFSGFASTAMYWWWDKYIEPYGLWYQFRGIADFLKDENLAHLSPGKGDITPNGASALVLSNPQRALVWIRSDSYTMPVIKTAFIQASLFDHVPQDWQFKPPTWRNLRLSLSGLKDGDYQAQLYAPQSAEWIGERRIQVQNGKITIAIPDLKSDLALKLVLASDK